MFIFLSPYQLFVYLTKWSKRQKIMHINDFLFLLSILNQDRDSLSAPSLGCLCQAGATSWLCVSRYRAMTPIPGLAIPVYFMEIPGFLHPIVGAEKIKYLATRIIHYHIFVADPAKPGATL